MKKHINTAAFAIALFLGSYSAYSFESGDMDVQVRGTVSETFDDNITFVNGDETEDLVTDLSFGVGLKFEGKTRGFELDANVIQQLFSGHNDFNNTSEDLTLNFRQEISKYDRMDLRNAFSHTYEPRSFEDAFGRTTGRYSYYRNRFNLDYTRDISKQFSVGAGYTNEIDAASRNGLSDSFLNGAKLEAAYAFTSSTLFRLLYNFTNRRFDPGTDSNIHTIIADVRHYLTKQLYFDGRAGLDLIESYDSRNYSRPLIQASLTNDIDENSLAIISFTKRYSANAYEEDLFDQWQVSGIFIRQLYKRLGCSFSGFYGEGEYSSQNITNRLSGASLSFSYDILKNVKGKLTYTYSNTDSTVDTRKYVKNTVFFGLSVEI